MQSTGSALRWTMHVGAAVIAVLSVGGAIAAPALAWSTNNPQWDVGATILASGESRSISAEAQGVQKFVSGETTFACSSVAVETGAVLLGSNAPSPGTSTETLHYGGCVVKLTSNGEERKGCKVNSLGQAAGTVITQNLISKLAFQTLGAAEEERESATVSVMKPEAGSKFAELELSGEACPFPGVGKYAIEGEVVARNKEGNVHTSTHLLEEPATAVKVYFYNNAGTSVEERVKGLKAFGGSATSVGNILVTPSPSVEWWIFG